MSEKFQTCTVFGAQLRALGRKIGSGSGLKTWFIGYFHSPSLNFFGLRNSGSGYNLAKTACPKYFGFTEIQGKKDQITLKQKGIHCNRK